MKIRQNPIFPQSMPELVRELGVLWRELSNNVLTSWRLPVYTTATLPTVNTVGDIAFTTDGQKHTGSGYDEIGSIVFFDGTAWRNLYHRHYRTAVVSLSPPSMGNNAVWETSFTTSAQIDTGFGWVSEGNMVSVGAPFGAPTGFLWNAFVSAEDEITFRLYNRSGGTIDPDTGNWSFAVFPQV